MNARYWLIGCALGLIGASPSMAASADAQDVVSSSHVSENSTRDNGDMDPLVARDCPPAGADDSRDSHHSDNSGSRSGGAAPASRSSSRSRLGWQSLLPGSIQ